MFIDKDHEEILGSLWRRFNQFNYRAEYKLEIDEIIAFSLYLQDYLNISENETLLTDDLIDVKKAIDTVFLPSIHQHSIQDLAVLCYQSHLDHIKFHKPEKSLLMTVKYLQKYCLKHRPELKNIGHILQDYAYYHV